MTAPLRIGILNDLSAAPPMPTDVERWLRLSVDELTRADRLDRAVEFVYAHGLGLPSGAAAAVERAYVSLVQQDVLMIVGPCIGDNALVAAPLAEHHRVPTLNWAGAERARGEYMFQLQVGSHEDESIVIARYVAACGIRRLGVIYDQSPIGRRHLQFLQAEADILGMRIVAATPVTPLTEHARTEVEQVLEARPDAFIYLGLGISAPAVAQDLKERAWNGLRCMNTAGLRGYVPGFARRIEGWTYVDMHSDSNRTLGALAEREQVPAGKKLAAAKGYDLGRLVAEALARASARTRDGVKEGLEAVKWLAAAEGHEGTLLGFGTWDRGALHGRYLVLRQWRDGESVEIQSTAQ